jgi:glutaminyl-peptide cyclotransferase
VHRLAPRLLPLLALATLGALAAIALAPARARPASRETSVKEASQRFDAPAAMALIRTELRYGQRPAGSPQLQNLAVRLLHLLPHAHLEPLPGEPGLDNVVASLPGSGTPVLIGAHYDTLAAPPGFLGANNGASGSAIVVELARELAALHRPTGAPALRFVLFDGEEPPAGLPEQQLDFYDSGLRGSRAYVAAHPGGERAMILLDYVAGRNLRLPREATSTPSLWAKVRAAAAGAGAQAAFPDAVGPGILDDHTPFLRTGVPAVDLIDWSYPGHTLQDTYAALSQRSVQEVGDTLLALLSRPWRG